jgi:hypothetical protein
MAMLPNEYEPLKLTARQQEVHHRYTAMGFRICARPFAGKGDHLWFFMSLPTEDNPRGVEFTIDLQSGIAHRTGTQTTYEMDAAEKEFGGSATGERQGNFENPPSAVPAAAPAPPVSKDDHAKAQSCEAKPVAERAEPAKIETQRTLGGLTPPRSPVSEKSVPVKKKQTALF